jgi:hypothetical protein
MGIITKYSSKNKNLVVPKSGFKRLGGILCDKIIKAKILFSHEDGTIKFKVLEGEAKGRESDWTYAHYFEHYFEPAFEYDNTDDYEIF